MRHVYTICMMTTCGFVCTGQRKRPFALCVPPLAQFAYIAHPIRRRPTPRKKRLTQKRRVRNIKPLLTAKHQSTSMHVAVQEHACSQQATFFNNLSHALAHAHTRATVCISQDICEQLHTQCTMSTCANDAVLNGERAH